MLNTAGFVTCSAVASVLDLSEQQCRLLLDTLTAVAGSSDQQQQQQQGLEPPVNLHQLSLFLLAQIYGREAHKWVHQSRICWQHQPAKNKPSPSHVCGNFQHP
jgi:hypothetical protein